MPVLRSLLMAEFEDVAIHVIKHFQTVIQRFRFDEWADGGLRGRYSGWRDHLMRWDSSVTVV